MVHCDFCFCFFHFVFCFLFFVLFFFCFLFFVFFCFFVFLEELWVFLNQILIGFFKPHACGFFLFFISHQYIRTKNYNVKVLPYMEKMSQENHLNLIYNSENNNSF